MNRLSTAKRVQVIAALVEGNSINATCRMFGVGKHTVLRLLEDAGCACAAYHHRYVRGLRVRRLQCDEIWAFVGAKRKNVSPEQDVYQNEGRTNALTGKVFGRHWTGQRREIFYGESKPSFYSVC